MHVFLQQPAKVSLSLSTFFFLTKELAGFGRKEGRQEGGEGWIYHGCFFIVPAAMLVSYDFSAGVFLRGTADRRDLGEGGRERVEEGGEEGTAVGLPVR